MAHRLGSGDRDLCPRALVQRRVTSDQSHSTVLLHLPMAIQKRSVESRMVIPGRENGSNADPALIKAMAQRTCLVRGAGNGSGRNDHGDRRAGERDGPLHQLDLGPRVPPAAVRGGGARRAGNKSLNEVHEHEVQHPVALDRARWLS